MGKKLIDEAVYKSAQQALAKMGNNGTTANKLKAVSAAFKHGVHKVAAVFDVNPSSIYRWSKKIKNGDFESLVNQRKLKDGIVLKSKHKTEIAEWLKADPNHTIASVMLKLKEHFDITPSKSTVHRAMQACGYSYITPRPKHYKQDKTKVQEFKKKSPKAN